MTDAMQLLLPEPMDLIPLLSGLFGRDVVVRPCDDLDMSACTNRSADYIDDEDVALVVVGTDLAFASHAGAALAMIPRSRAEDAVKSGTDDPDLLEIYGEVLNILTRPINDSNDCHVRLVPGTVGTSSEPSSAAVAAGFTISIDNYGEGKLGFWRV